MLLIIMWQASILVPANIASLARINISVTMLQPHSVLNFTPLYIFGDKKSIENKSFVCHVISMCISKAKVFNGKYN